jgi:hypothetical protein
MADRTRAQQPKSSIADLPHSWDVSTWPPSVWPGDPSRARWILRSHRTELLEAGALARTSKVLIILGRGYARWLDKRIAHVGDFESNNPKLRQPSAA